MVVDPTEKGAQYKKEQIAKLINFTEEQKIIVDLYILEEKTKERHWKLDPEDPQIYIEWMNGTTILRNKVNERLNMTRAQKIAMNNNSTVQQGNNNNLGNNNPVQRGPVLPPQVPPTTPAAIQGIQQQQQPTSTFQHRPINPGATTNKQIKRYPRRSRK